jgi:eukaryotic-like serine/threonine-protein kinase
LRLSHRSEDGTALYRNFRKAQQSGGFSRPHFGYELSKPSMSSTNDVLPPRYLRPTRIGYGGMGEIFRAEDEVLGRMVAIKVLSARYAGDDSLRARFTREALAAARLSGESGAVTIFDVGDWDGRPFIVMEYLAGGSLEARLSEGGPPPVDESLAWLDQAASALDAAHRLGVVHRDVKPGNLLLDHDGDLRVADFGIASAAGLHSLTLTGTVLGTAGYLSPEQARGERATAASDRYSLAVVAYELLSGRRPFESESPTTEAAAHVQAEVPSISPQLDPVFRRALAKDSEERFATASGFVAALRAALEGEAATTRVIPAGRKRSPWTLVAALVAAALLAGAGLAALFTGNGDQPQAVHRTGAATTATHPPPAPPPPPPARPPPPAPPPPTPGGTSLTDQATSLLRAGDPAGAERLARQALALLLGSGATYEAYAEYDLGAALAQLGQCDEALQHLENSRQLQGNRPEIRDAEKLCRGSHGHGGKGGDNNGLDRHPGDEG